MTTAMIQLRDGTLAHVAVYRNGDEVTVRGVGEQQTPNGPIRVKVEAEMNVPTFQWCRAKAIERMGTLAYTRIIGRLGIDDNVMRAPPLPAASSRPRFQLPPRR